MLHFLPGLMCRSYCSFRIVSSKVLMFLDKIDTSTAIECWANISKSNDTARHIFELEHSLLTDYHDTCCGRVE